MLSGLFISGLPLFAQSQQKSQNIRAFPPPPEDGIYSYHGKRLKELESEKDFFICAIKILQIEENQTCLDVFFTSEIDPMSIKADSILILPLEDSNNKNNDWVEPEEMSENQKEKRMPPPRRPPLKYPNKKLPQEEEKIPPCPKINTNYPFTYQFMKNSRGIRFIITNEEENFNLIIQNIKSWQGLEIQALKLEKVSSNAQYLYSWREKIWKKS